MPRSKTVKINGKDFVVQERRIGEIENLVAEVFPETGGDLSKLDLTKVDVGFGLLYDKLPIVFPGLTAEDVKNAYMSEIEALVEAFVDVNFRGLKRLVPPLTALAQAGSPRK